MSSSDLNVLLLILDSVRAENLSIYGYNRKTTPFIDELASESVVYERPRSPGVWSFPSHVSLFIGRSVAEHGVLDWNQHVSGESIMWDDGYPTGVFSTNPFVIKD